ncbi:haloacid dehalogenase [Methanobrevibacter sp. 87.7]|uniref:HAD family hydrolase n=1 Tax=Methanobrevibacter sp. 87.7 TaxID=387957 RepID=UPI000B50D6D1|nr:HAD family hydrolase [Methanobrevibacter sp. 87.7]OWT33184.1 haloacid dehalogenase [Methanobrevibacter sp. 87.7]
MNKKAIVFDNSGTLIKRYKILNDIENKKFITDKNSFEIIHKLECAALIILQFNTKCLSKLDPNTKISDLFFKYNINFSISYSSTKLSHDDVLDVIRNDNNAIISDITNGFGILKEQVPNMEICNGTALIIDCKNKKILYTITTAGKLFANAQYTVNKLKNRGYEIFIASGDRVGAIQTLTKFLDIDSSHGFPTASPVGKKKIVKHLQSKGYNVTMVGDGPNDYFALNQADCGILTIAQSLIEEEYLLLASDYLINDLIELLNILY